MWKCPNHSGTLHASDKKTPAQQQPRILELASLEAFGSLRSLRGDRCILQSADGANCTLLQRSWWPSQAKTTASLQAGRHRNYDMEAKRRHRRAAVHQIEISATCILLGLPPHCFSVSVAELLPCVSLSGQPLSPVASRQLSSVLVSGSILVAPYQACAVRSPFQQLRSCSETWTPHRKRHREAHFCAEFLAVPSKLSEEAATLLTNGQHAPNGHFSRLEFHTEVVAYYIRSVPPK